MFDIDYRYFEVNNQTYKRKFHGALTSKQHTKPVCIFFIYDSSFRSKVEQTCLAISSHGFTGDEPTKEGRTNLIPIAPFSKHGEQKTAKF